MECKDEKKKQVIKHSIECNQPEEEDVIDVLSKVGGFDIAAMCGAFLGAAAVCAVKLCPNVREYLIPSHASYEIGYQLAMKYLKLEPIFLLGMRLGEGSGCPLAFQVLKGACAVLNDMATFEEEGIDDEYLEKIREGDKFTVEDKR